MFNLFLIKNAHYAVNEIFNSAEGTVLADDNNIEQFLTNITESEMDHFLAEYIRTGMRIRDHVTGEEKLPTSGSFQTYVSFIKRIITMKLGRTIGNAL